MCIGFQPQPLRCTSCCDVERMWDEEQKENWTSNITQTPKHCSRTCLILGFVLLFGIFVNERGSCDLQWMYLRSHTDVCYYVQTLSRGRMSLHWETMISSNAGVCERHTHKAVVVKGWSVHSTCLPTTWCVTHQCVCPTSGRFHSGLVPPTDSEAEEAWVKPLSNLEIIQRKANTSLKISLSCFIIWWNVTFIWLDCKLRLLLTVIICRNRKISLLGNILIHCPT